MLMPFPFLGAVFLYLNAKCPFRTLFLCYNDSKGGGNVDGIKINLENVIDELIEKQSTDFGSIEMTSWRTIAANFGIIIITIPRPGGLRAEIHLKD